MQTLERRHFDNTVDINGTFYKLFNHQIYNLFTHTVIADLSKNNQQASITNSDVQAIQYFKQRK